MPSIEDRIYLLEEKLKIAESRINILERELFHYRHYPDEMDYHIGNFPHFPASQDVTIIGDSIDSWAREIKIDKSRYVRLSGDTS